MAPRYSTYEAKTRFSEILRRVRAGEQVVVTWHGKDVAVITPIERGDDDLGVRLDALERRGLLESRPARARPLRPIAPRPGALERFLEERD